MRRPHGKRLLRLFGLPFAALLLTGAPARAVVVPFPLAQVPVPEPLNLGRFVADREAAIRLGKALFWDMQVGSDGRTACASCHFHAGTDNRVRNTLHPGSDGAFAGGRRANDELAVSDFPFVRFAAPFDRLSPRTVVSNDRVGSQGVNRTRSQGLAAGRSQEPGRSIRDATFQHLGRNVRQATGRNAPSVINAAFNFANFWDGRANPYFNGVNPFGIMDTQARVYRNDGDALTALDLVGNRDTNPYALDNASLASQAVGPVLSDVEMSWIGRSWPEVGRKLLALRPLAGQQVHPEDSRLATLRAGSGRGLDTTYAAMVQAAFQPEFWNSPARIDGYSQMEQNFSLFFGLAVQLYEATLIADQTPFDRFLAGDTAALSDSARRGMELFLAEEMPCLNCHLGAELTSATVSNATGGLEAALVEVMPMADTHMANYDIGYYNIAATPTTDDAGRGARVTLNGASLPLSFTGQWFERETLPFPPLQQPACFDDPLLDPPFVCPPDLNEITRQAVSGSFKTPGLRNVELTGPYMHDGGMTTLMQVVEFYARGGNFHVENSTDLHPSIIPLPQLQGDAPENVQARRDLVDFLLALTDERVRWEQAPFDHPQLLLVNGHEARLSGNPRRSRELVDRVVEIPAVGAAGREIQQLPPLRPFLAPAALSNAEFHYLP